MADLRPSMSKVTSKSSPIETSAASDSGLPDFAQPPVDETALSIQFAPIPGFNIPHFGLFWSRIRDRYPNFEIQQPITNVTEQFDAAVLPRQIELAFLSLPDIRCWYLEDPSNRLLQVQRDRFVHNWRKLTGAEQYPRYPSLRASLEKEWDGFCAFLRDEKLGTPKVNQCEVTYVNHIEYDKGWRGYGDLDKVVAAFATPKRRNRFLPDPERVDMQVSYRVEENAGRLHVSFLPVIRGRDGKEVLQMTLTARGAPASSEAQDVFHWLDLARRWVVRGFADFTSLDMHKIWEKQ